MHVCIKRDMLNIILHFRMETGTALQDMDNATILSELEAQGEEVMRQWSSLLNTCQTLQETNDSNTINNNVNSGSANNNNQPANEIGCVFKAFISLSKFLIALYCSWIKTTHDLTIDIITFRPKCIKIISSKISMILTCFFFNIILTIVQCPYCYWYQCTSKNA